MMYAPGPLPEGPGYSIGKPYTKRRDIGPGPAAYQVCALCPIVHAAPCNVRPAALRRVPSAQSCEHGCPARSRDRSTGTAAQRWAGQRPRQGACSTRAARCPHGAAVQTADARRGLGGDRSDELGATVTLAAGCGATGALPSVCVSQIYHRCAPLACALCDSCCGCAPHGAPIFTTAGILFFKLDLPHL
jgi:hypothetical protein